MGEPTDPSQPSGRPPGDRLDSWKEVAVYLDRDITTVRRWEKREGMPVHRHLHDKLGSVYAYRSELDRWMERRAGLRDEGSSPEAPGEAAAPEVLSPGAETSTSGSSHLQGDGLPARPPRVRVGLLVLSALLLAGAAWYLVGPPDVGDHILDGARFQGVTDFEGTDQAAAVSRDGRFVAFLSDRDGRTDVWVTQLGTGQFYNLTRGRARELVNPAVRTLGFSPDGALVTFWARGIEGVDGTDIGIWAIPTLGGDPRPYLEGAVEYDWSRDGTTLVYHTPAPGDPTIVADEGRRPVGPPVFTAPAGLHAHFQTWSRDGASIYFVQGSVPDALDLYRMGRDGQGIERLTWHDAGVSHPVLLDERTLLYLVREKDGSGSRLHALDVERRVPHPLGTGLDRYYSLAASADGRRLVATLANTKGTLWRLPVADADPAGSGATPVALPTGRGFSPRMGPGYLLYVASTGAAQGIWRLADGVATEIWSAAGARITGGPEIAADGRRVAVTVERDGKSLLYVMNADGTGARVLSEALELRGAAAWTRDGQALTSGATLGGAPQLVQIALDGPVSPLVRQFGVDPAWSPDGSFVAYSGADVGTELPLRAAWASGADRRVPHIMLRRGARRLRFVPSGQGVIMMRGDIRHRDLWLVDLDTGAQRQLTRLPPDFLLRDFDVSPDGRELVVERVQEHADVVLIELAPPR